MKFLIMTIIGLGASIANANEPAPEGSVVVRTCDDKTPTSLEFFVAGKSYSNHQIRVFSVDTYGEPACCSQHLVVYMPAKDVPLSSKCFHVAMTSDGLGFYNLDLAQTKSGYNSNSGLSITVPFSFYDVETNITKSESRTLLINQATQKIEVK